MHQCSFALPSFPANKNRKSNFNKMPAHDSKRMFLKKTGNIMYKYYLLVNKYMFVRLIVCLFIFQCKNGCNF